MYRTIDVKIWDDEKVQALGQGAKLLFVYLLTNRHSHVSGIYYLPDVLIASELRLGAPLDALWDALSNGLAIRDHERQIVWVKNMMGYQGRGQKIHQAAAKQLDQLHNSFLIMRFVAYYPEVGALLSKEQKGRLVDGVSDRASVKEQEQEKDQEKDQEQMTTTTNRARAHGDKTGAGGFTSEEKALSEVVFNRYAERAARDEEEFERQIKDGSQ